jgi:hypothetical protein
MVYHILKKRKVFMKKDGNPNKDWRPDDRIAYDRTPVQLKVMPGVRERLKSVSDWQNKVRRAIDDIIANGEGG